MPIRGIHLAAFVLLSSSLSVTPVRAQDTDVLTQCTALSPLLDDIHNCLDNYLDGLDSNMDGITGFLAGSLSGESLAGLRLSQQAFVEYRKQNCLWYLNFSSPRSEAEQIAKNCLVNLSLQRVKELRSLLEEEDTSGQVVAGFYVFGPERNSFQRCGSNERHWLEGDLALVGQAQQQYLSLASSELQVMYAEFGGSLDESAQAPPEHAGVFKLSAVIDISLPTESNCSLPNNLSVAAAVLPNTTTQAPAELADTQSEALQDQDEPQQQLIAYFGAWLADCTENDGLRSCRLEVAMEDGSGTVDNSIGEFAVIRESGESTELELVFLGREIDSPARIHWTVDGWDFGDIVGSNIRVDEVATRQLVSSGRFLRAQLLPLLIKAVEIKVEVLADVDDESGEVFTATLRGLTRSLAFADEFVREAAQ